MFDAILSLLTVIACFLAVTFLIDQEIVKPRPYKVVWAVGLFVYGIGALAQFFATSSHWTGGTYRFWYLAGAVLAAPYLGMGTYYLLGSRRVANVLMTILGIFTVYAVARVLTVPLTPQASAHQPAWTLPASAHGSVATWLTTASNADIVTGNHPLMPGDIIAIIIILNSLGALALVGGAAWSAWKFVRTRQNSNRLLSMVLLVIGGLAPTAAGSLDKTGNAAPFFVLTFIGSAFLLAGYLVSIDVLSVLRIPFTDKVLVDRTAAAAKPSAR